MEYERDGFYDYLKHLLHSLMCREYASLSYTAVLAWFRRLEESRQQLFHPVTVKENRNDGDVGDERFVSGWYAERPRYRPHPEVLGEPHHETSEKGQGEAGEVADDRGREDPEE